MEFKKFKGHNVIVGKDQPEYRPLYAYLDIDDDRRPVSFCLELTDNEIERLKVKKEIWFTQLIFNSNFQPVLASLESPVPINKEIQLSLDFEF